MTFWLQRGLDVYNMIHNFILKYWTTGKSPAVAMGSILCVPSGLKDILMMQKKNYSADKKCAQALQKISEGDSLTPLAKQ